MNNFNPFEAAHIGTENITSRRRKNIIYSYNLLQLFFIFLIFLLFISEMISGNPTGAVVSFSCSAILVGLYLLSRKGHFALSTFLFCVIMPSVIFMLSIYYKGVNNTAFYFVFFMTISLIFSVSAVRSMGLSIFCLTLAALSYHFRTTYGTISEMQFDQASNIGLLVAFGLGAFLLCYVLVVNATNNETYIDGILASLKAKNGELELTNKKLAVFSQMASHDLKVPIAGVGSMINIIERKVKDQDYDSISEITQAVKESTEQMVQMITDTLEYGKTSHYDDTPKEMISMTQIINLLTTDIKYSFPTAEVNHSNLPNIIENRDRVKKIFQNLIQNGLKYNQSDKPLINITYSSSALEHIFTIEDNGIGIDSKDLEDIFTPYKRLHGNDEYTGTGLGLAIVKEILTLAKGKIEVCSEQDKGTCFTIYLPIHSIKSAQKKN